MLRYLTYIVLFLALANCSKPIYLNDLALNREGMLGYGQTPERTFYIDLSVSTDFKQRWVAEADGSFGSSSIIVYDEYVFASDLSGKVFCFSDTSGKKIGVIKQKGEIAGSPVISKDKLIYVVNNHKEMYATLCYYQFVQGNMYKEIELNDNFTSEIISTDTGIFLLSQKGTIYKYNLIAEQEWQYEAKVLTYSNPFLVDNILYFATINGEIIGFDTEKRKIVLIDRIAIGFESSPLVVDNRIIIGDVEGVLYSYNPVLKEIEWEVETGFKIINQPVIDKDGNLYIGNLGGILNCINRAGEKIWEYKSDGVFNTEPLVFNNIVLQSDLNHQLLMLNRKTGKLENKITYENRVRTSPVYFNGKIYVGVDRSDIFSYEVFIK